jgi:hypothetical protein
LPIGVADECQLPENTPARVADVDSGHALLA